MVYVREEVEEEEEEECVCGGGFHGPWSDFLCCVIYFELGREIHSGCFESVKKLKGTS